MEIKIPDKIQVGGFQFDVEDEEEELHSKNCWGDSSNALRRIRLYPRQKPVELSNSFIHELLHCIDYIYIEKEITEDQIRVLANGLHQAFESMGIRFVR